MSGAVQQTSTMWLVRSPIAIAAAGCAVLIAACGRRASQAAAGNGPLIAAFPRCVHGLHAFTLVGARTVPDRAGAGGSKNPTPAICTEYRARPAVSRRRSGRRRRHSRSILEFIRATRRRLAANDEIQTVIIVDGRIAARRRCTRDRLGRPQHEHRLLAGGGVPGTRHDHRGGSCLHEPCVQQLGPEPDGAPGGD